ncbi:MAG: sigma-70 family RNA polymerase sigma factor [Planctomycetes bacterium]|nr:sigma-70 family RNA polymerase sigma factor [Planctomycetota bacterium]
MDDFALVREVREGSEAAFRALVERYQDRIVSLVYRFLGDHDESEDVAQEIFLKVFRKLDSFQFESSFYTWLYRIAINAAQDRVKRRRRQRTSSLDDLPPVFASTASDAGPTDRVVLTDEIGAAVREKVDELPPKYKAVIVLREFEGHTYEEISEILRCSIGTVESRLFRARQRLMRKLQRFWRS